MRYFIGRDGEGLFLIEGAVEGDMLATRPIAAAHASLQMKAIEEYLKRGEDEGDPVARTVAEQDYERIKSEPRSMIGLDALLSELPLSEISQESIKEAYLNTKHRFQAVGVPL